MGLLKVEQIKKNFTILAGQEIIQEKALFEERDFS